MQDAYFDEVYFMKGNVFCFINGKKKDDEEEDISYSRLLRASKKFKVDEKVNILICDDFSISYAVLLSIVIYLPIMIFFFQYYFFLASELSFN